MLQPHQPGPNTTGRPVTLPWRYKTSRWLEKAGGQAQAAGAAIWKVLRVSGFEELKQTEES